MDWLFRIFVRVRRPTAGRAGPAGGGAPLEGPAAGEPPLWVIQPPNGVRLVESRGARTGEGGQGVVARYSDGTTAMAVVNTDGSVRVLFFRGTVPVPAVLVAGASRAYYTWKPADEGD